MIHIVLINPEIPQNTGNIGRTCVGLGAHLHLVGEIGFSLEERALKRAGLDYWGKLKWTRHETWEAFLSTVESDAQITFFSTHGKTELWDWTCRRPAYLVFGSESVGLPKSFYERYKDTLVRIPSGPDIRSLNLATAVGVAAFEASRQIYNRVHA